MTRIWNSGQSKLKLCELKISNYNISFCNVMLTVQINYCLLYYTAFQNDIKKFQLIMGGVNDNHHWMLMVRLNIANITIFYL